jgi:hypothetical protein
MKVIVVPRKEDKSNEQYNHLVGAIVSATNWQNQISQADLKSNDINQVRIQRDLKKLNYMYLRKRMKINDARRIYGDRYSIFIKKEDLAKAVAACNIDPYYIRLGKDRLFEDDIYKVLFKDRPSTEFINYYWISQIVSWYSRKDSRKGYAKWLVMNYIYEYIRGELRNKGIRDNFRYTCEREYYYTRKFWPFYNAIKTTYSAAINYYNSHKKSDGKVFDASTYFKHINHHIEFKKYVQKNKKILARKISKNCEAFIENIRNIEH